MFAIYLRSAGLLRRHPASRRAWMYVAVNRERRAFMATVNGRDEFAFHTQLHARSSGRADHRRATRKAMFQEALGRAARHRDHRALGTWTAGLHAGGARNSSAAASSSAATRCICSRPTGGLGYNTAVEDAVNLGWKLAAVLRAGAALRCSTATRPSARRWPSATPPTRAALPIRSACSCRRRSWRTTVPAGEAGAQAHRRPLQPPRALRIQHSRHHLRRPLRRLADRSCRTARAPPPDAAEQLPAHRHAPAAARRILARTMAARSTTRFDFEWTLLALGAGRADTGAVCDAARRRWAWTCTVVRIRSTKRAISTRRRSGADPPRPDRGLARQFGGRRDRRAAPRGRAVTGIERSGSCGRVFPHHRFLALADHVDGGPGIGQRRRRPGPVFQLAGVVTPATPERQPLAKPARFQHDRTATRRRCACSRTRSVPGSKCGTPRRVPARSGPGCTHRDNRRERTSNRSSGRLMTSLIREDRAAENSLCKAAPFSIKQAGAEIAKPRCAIHNLRVSRLMTDRRSVKKRGPAAPAPWAWPAAWSSTPPPTGVSLISTS